LACPLSAYSNCYLPPNYANPDCKPIAAFVRTKYKRRTDKIRPVANSDGSMPGGLASWLTMVIDRISLAGLSCPVDSYDQFFSPKFSTIQRGSRLTSEWISLLRMNPFI
jgi:hypothetical protein